MEPGVAAAPGVEEDLVDVVADGEVPHPEVPPAVAGGVVPPSREEEEQVCVLLNTMHGSSD